MEVRWVGESRRQSSHEIIFRLGCCPSGMCKVILKPCVKQYRMEQMNDHADAL